MKTIGAQFNSGDESDEWMPIETAPTDGTPFQAIIPGHGSDNIIAATGDIEMYDGSDCWAWAFVEDQEPPESWDDGICWASNSIGEPSVRPTHWKPLRKRKDAGR